MQNTTTECEQLTMVHLVLHRPPYLDEDDPLDLDRPRPRPPPRPPPRATANDIKAAMIKQTIKNFHNVTPEFPAR